MLLPLNSGAYQARGDIASYLICENLYPELNPQEVEPTVPMTHYQREGQRLLSQPPVLGAGRGVFSLSNGNLIAVAGVNVYFVDRTWTWNLLGQIDPGNTPVSIADNRTTALLVDGTPNGYTITLGTNAFAVLVDATGTFIGSARVDYCDTFIAVAMPNSNNWTVTLSDQIVFQALSIAGKASSPDNISTVIFNLRNAWVLGAKSGTEVWYNAGSTPLPYQEWPNVFIPYGCISPFGIVRADIDLFWISLNDQGQAIAVKTSGMSAVLAFSTRALEYEWSTYPTVADVIAGTFQLAGHVFVIFHFPTADRTWAYDLSTKQWHRRIWTDGNGVSHREKVAFYAVVGAEGGYPPTIVGQDWKTGAIYALDNRVGTDNGDPIVCRRSFPHVVSEMKEVTHTAFVADFATGNVPNVGEAVNAPQLFMRYSNNGGKTFSNYRGKKLISAGNYRSMMRWRGLGMARDRVFELMWSFPGPATLNGAYIDPLAHQA